MESPGTFPESPMEQDDVVYPCKGCGEILEEGKAFELAGNRWHIDCFRCNTCGTLLDSDANLLLLGDGSLICNNCTYSCSACGNKIEDLAILTGDQAFCASCFRCRNCKRKIENLRYARTSQGIFCMSCHESLMARRRKKSKAARQASAQPNGSAPVLDKSLPALPPNAANQPSYESNTEADTPPDSYGNTPVDLSPLPRPSRSKKETFSDSGNRNISPASAHEPRKKNLALPSSSYRENRHSMILIDRDAPAGNSQNGLFVPLALSSDTTPVPSPGPKESRTENHQAAPEHGKLVDNKPPAQDYFDHVKGPSTSQREAPREKRSESSRSGSVEKEGQPVLSKQVGQSAAGSMVASPEINRDKSPPPYGESPSFNLNSFGQGPGFKLQEVPKQKKSAGSGQDFHPGLREDASPSPSLDVGKVTGATDRARTPSPTSGGHSPLPQSLQEGKHFADSPSSSQLERSTKEFTPTLEKPKREDSLPAAGVKLPLPGKEAPSNTNQDLSTPSAPIRPPRERNMSASAGGSHLNGGRTISKPLESPTSRSLLDSPLPPVRSSGRQAASGEGTTADSFTAPRAPPAPPPPTHERHRASESVSTQSDQSRELNSPSTPVVTLPRYSAGGEFSMDEDMARIMRGEEPSENSASVLRRVSNAVSKHGRSFSDRGSRSSTSARWKVVGSGSIDITSPTSASPDSKEEASQLRNHLRRAQQRIAELEAEKNGLQEKVNSSADIKQVNTELKEKRSTVAFLDTQREMVVRELEIMTDHLAKVKESGRPLDINNLKTEILQDFALSLQKLKDNLTTQIEDLVHKRNELTDEISNLIQMKDKGFQEYESLSTKNAQLAEVHAHLVHSIQDTMFKAGRHPNGGSVDNGRPSANGLGIYSHHHDDKSDMSVDVRSIMAGDSSLSTLLQEHDADSNVLPAPQVVNIRKGQPKKFNWKKGGHVVAKNVTKGLNRAFASSQYPNRDIQQTTEGVPYGSLPTNSDSTPSSSISKASGDPSRAGFGFFTQKSSAAKSSQAKHFQNHSSTNLLSGDSSMLFGSELQSRCDVEKRVIPTIVTRCIEEVELRGMNVEGIYRKSGGAGQVKTVQVGFEKNLEYDISDPDLDIHAVTSALKQYFRKLPTPLITFDVYDQLLDAAQVQDRDKRAQALRVALNGLPRSHHDCLEFLVFHLARVVENESENLMTPLNLAVVFAPTIMRPLSVEREMADMQLQRMAVQAILENNKVIFTS